jgi:ubiquinone/menaquinone biosynthesis C-methylase UbiE
MGSGLPLTEITRRYDQLARLYSRMEWLFAIHAGARRRAVRALCVKPGATVLEVGCGTGRNFPYLVEAVGAAGRVVGVDASPGMLAEAQRLIRSHRWVNVELHRQDAAELRTDVMFDAVLFSLSYSVIPASRIAALRAWDRLKPGGRLVVMDAGIPDTALGRILDPFARLLVKLAPGDPYARPWEDLRELGEPQCERFLLGIYYVVANTKPTEVS